MNHGAHHVKAYYISPSPIIANTYASAKKPIVATVTPEACLPYGDKLYHAYCACMIAHTMRDVTPDASSDSPI